MSKLDSFAQDFLAQKKIAIVGVSDKRETGCNLGYRKFKEAGYEVYAVQVCRENGITVIPGACPNQFLKPDFFHSFAKFMWRTLGFQNMN